MTSFNLVYYLSEHITTIETAAKYIPEKAIGDYKPEDINQLERMVTVHLELPVVMFEPPNMVDIDGYKTKVAQVLANDLENMSGKIHTLEQLIIEMDGWVGTTAVDDWDRMSRWKKDVRKIINPSRFRD